MPIKSRVGEVWWADLGLAAKNRPVLVLACPSDREARQMIVVVPLTSQIRGMDGEVPLGPVRWLPKPSAVNVQGIASFDPGKLDRKMGVCTSEQMGAIKQALRDLLDL